MKFRSAVMNRSVVGKSVIGAVAAIVAFGVVCGGTAAAEPAQDAVAQLKELRREAEQLTESMQTAQADLESKLRQQSQAEKRHADDLVLLDAAKAQQAEYQGTVDRLAAAVYMGGPSNGLSAILTTASPQMLIDRLDVQRVMATTATQQLQGFRQATQQVQTIEAASAESAATAKSAADAAAAVQADLKKKQSELQTQVAALKVRYAMLAPAQQAAVGLGGPIPLVGMGGLVPNARALVAYIIETYPGVQSIGGVRADPLPDHPSGHAIDIMIGTDMALGDAINADVQSQAGQFGVVYTMWRVPSHFNHVHVTVS